MKTRDGKPPTHFEVIGAGSAGYQPADATIEGNRVTLTSEKCENPVAFRFAWDKLAEPNLTGSTGLPVGAFRGGEEPSFASQLSIDSEYQLVYEIDLSKLGRDIEYSVDHHDQVKDFSRVGYLLELRSEDKGDQAVFVTMDAFTQDVGKIGIPTASSAADFRQNVTSMEVFASFDGVQQDRSITSGSIEFWPNNYSPANERKVPGASPTRFDFGDQPGMPVDGYGSMQVHNVGAKETVFAINHWSSGNNADIGIGNNAGDNSDWTFSGSGANYSKKRLSVYVK